MSYYSRRDLDVGLPAGTLLTLAPSRSSCAVQRQPPPGQPKTCRFISSTLLLLSGVPRQPNVVLSPGGLGVEHGPERPQHADPPSCARPLAVLHSRSQCFVESNAGPGGLYSRVLLSGGVCMLLSGFFVMARREFFSGSDGGGTFEIAGLILQHIICYL